MDLDLEERYRRVLRRLPSWPDDGPSHSVPSPGRSAGSERYQSREQGRGQARTAATGACDLFNSQASHRLEPRKAAKLMADEAGVAGGPGGGEGPWRHRGEQHRPGGGGRPGVTTELNMLPAIANANAPAPAAAIRITHITAAAAPGRCCGAEEPGVRLARCFLTLRAVKSQRRRPATMDSSRTRGGHLPVRTVTVLHADRTGCHHDGDPAGLARRGFGGDPCGSGPQRP